jgi:SsrA-binding protein
MLCADAAAACCAASNSLPVAAVINSFIFCEWFIFILHDCFTVRQNYIKFVKSMARTKTNIEIKNKRASFEYEFLETFTAGIALAGTEIKSIRAGKASLADAYGYFSGNELYIKNMHIAEYWWGNLNNHDPRRDRKLLLQRKELSKLRRRSVEKGLTIVAVKLFIAENGYAKLIIALARGKKIYDKRAGIKEKDLRRAEIS